MISVRYKIGLGLIVCFALIAVASHAASEPLRVATLLPFVEDALDGVGGEVVVVASVRRSMHRPVAEGLIDLGNPHSPNLENLAESGARLVIGDADIHGRFVEPISRLGAEVLLLDTSGVEATLGALSAVADRIGGNAILAGRIATVRREIEAASLPETVSILALFGSPGSFFVISEQAWLGDLAAQIGFNHAVVGQQESDRFPGLIPVSDEVMALARPDLVVLVAHGDPAKIQSDLLRKTKRGGAWAGLASARYGINVLDPRLFSANPGLEMGRAARALEDLVEIPLGKKSP